MSLTLFGNFQISRLNLTMMLTKITAIFFMVFLTSCAAAEEKPGGLTSHWDEIIEDEEEEDEEIWDEIEEDTEENGKHACEMLCMTLTLISLFTAKS